MAYELPKLDYDYAALEPHIDAQTMEIHHSKHHQAYVTNLNKALEGHPDLASKDIQSLISDLNAVPENIRTAVRNNGGGHFNHSLFWKVIGPGKGGEPSGALAEAINNKWGSFDKFKEAFETAGATRFGSGWAWLCISADKAINICSTPNQDAPVMKGIAECEGTPILGLDVWEHSYYLKYQNRRPEYMKAFWNVVDWDAVAKNYEAAIA
ncbi:MAG TPA: superoxide dismutase [Opitutales bacterium]|nr:superoxide dismutase [Opitutales bacterium]